MPRPRRLRKAVQLGLGFLSLGPSILRAQSSFDTLLAPHRAAMASLMVLDGVWRGDGWTILPSGEKATFRQTIRVGSTSQGTLKVIEGRSFNTEGKLNANTFEVISFNAATKAYSLRLYTQGNAADVPIVPTSNGFYLEYGDGSATVRFTVSVNSGRWNEIAERRAPNEAPVRFLQLDLARVSDTDWPAAGAVPPR